MNLSIHMSFLVTNFSFSATYVLYIIKVLFLLTNLLVPVRDLTFYFKNSNFDKSCSNCCDNRATVTMAAYAVTMTVATVTITTKPTTIVYFTLPCIISHNHKTIKYTLNNSQLFQILESKRLVYLGRANDNIIV